MQEIILARAKRFTDEEMLERLRQILAQHGRISGLLIDECDDLPSSASFRHRFGSLVRAYQLIGYTPDTDFSFIEVIARRRVRALDQIKMIQWMQGQGNIRTRERRVNFSSSTATSD